MKFFKGVTFSAASILAFAATLSGTPDRAAAGANPYLGDILAVGETFCPRGWVAADGQLLPISSNTALFSLLGTTFGGDGRTTFGLPDLRGRAAMGLGRGPGLTQRTIGQKLGAEGVVLNSLQLPSHTHAVNANNLDGDRPGPGGKLLAAAPPNGAGSETIYSDQPHNRTMSTQMIGHTGGAQPLGVQDPFLVMRYCVATVGEYPPRD